ncbi:hypothetical protein E0W80_04515 [Microbacterium sp. PI-1]|uniref:hypothetical protein n=1 Tax=Microbacterium sp. PI-1 TaxID=2545631 RepID=UPI00103A15CC|nr:hypothetical protein [Microbacterium sp. PI-1]TCJ28768.1 hypothetical protein E0W80_04515 [Microbacterium sp. PI-1]
MVVRCFVFETLSGNLLQEVEPSDLQWSENANQAETVDGAFDLNSTSEGSRDWRNLGTPWKHSIAVDANGRLLGGPIMPHDFSDAGGSLKLTARGGRIVFSRRSVLPPAALTQSLVLPNGEPDTSLDSTWAGFDLGTIAKKIGQQACAWPGSNMPIVWPEDRSGIRERTYAAIDRKNVDDAWSDLSKVENGPDIRMRLEWDGPDRFRWVFETGTEEQPRLQGPDAFDWEVGQGSGLSVQTNPSRMGSLSWSQGGRADDTTLVRSLYDPTLIDRGFPLLELESDASSNTVLPETLDSWNVETLRTAKKPWEFWSFNVRADESPYPFEYGPGSLINVTVTEDAPVAGGYVPPGTYTRRIAGLSGAISDWITVTCGEVYDS